MVCKAQLPVERGETILSLENVNIGYGKHIVLHELSVNFAAGRICGIFGPNGSGKTTLFKACLNILTPTKGDITLIDKPLTRYTASQLAQYIAYVPQESKQAFPFTVHEMVAMGRNPHRGLLPYLTQHDLHHIEHAIDRVGIADLTQTVYSTLSGGQRQLVLVARALAQNATLILLDEPTAALDFSNQHLVWETLIPIAQSGVTIIICCHDPNSILWYCDDALILQEGHAIAKGFAKEVMTTQLLQSLYGKRITMTHIDGKSFIYCATDKNM